MSKNNEVKLYREYEKPIKIFGKQLKVMRLILIALVFMVYTGFVYSETKTMTPLFFGSLGFLLLIFSLVLMTKKIIYIKDFNIECSDAGDVYLTKLRGKCPKCDGDLKIIKKFIRCEKDPNHIWDLATYKNN